MRIDRFLVRSNTSTRKGAKGLLKSKQIKVNGEIVTSANLKIDIKNDIVEYNGKVIQYKEYVYIMMNKPSGYISATKDNKHKTVVDIVQEEYGHYDLHPVGRLDIDTEGLMILTNDGKLTHEIISPKKHIPKTYFAKLRDEIDSSAVTNFKEGIILEDGYKCMEGHLRIINDKEIELTIYEGKYHQVKRMFEAIGNQVVYLKRVKMNKLELDNNLKLGEFRELSNDELDLLSS